MKFTSLNSRLLLLLCVSWMTAAQGFGQENMTVDGLTTINKNGEALKLNGSNNSITFYNGSVFNGYLGHTGATLNIMNRRPGHIAFGTNNLRRMMISSAGDVGIGTIFPTSKLHVSGGDNNGTDAPFRVVSGSQVMLMDGNEIDGLTDLSLNFNAATNVNIAAGGGNIGMGTTAPGNYKVKIVHGSYGLNIENSGASNNDWEILTNDGPSANLSLFCNNSLRGKFNCTSGAYTSTSDRRLKKNIVELEPVLDKVMRLEPSRYQFIDNNTRNEETIGFIAQDVEILFPEFVFKGTNERTKGIYTMDYSGFGILAIKAIQEQQKAIEALQILNHQVTTEKVVLEQRVIRLEEKLNDLIKQMTSKN